MSAPLLDAVTLDACILIALAMLVGLSRRLAASGWDRALQLALHAGAGVVLLGHPLPLLGGVSLAALPAVLLASRLGLGWGALAALPVLAVWPGFSGALGLGLLVVGGSLLRRVARPLTGRWGWWPFAALFGAASLAEVALGSLTLPAALALTLCGTLACGLWTGLLQALDSPHQQAAAFRSLAYHDALTGLLGRRAFDRDWPARQHPEHFLLLLDLDHFKRLNDTYGHDGGDRVLQAFGQVCRESVRANDQIYRLGGEEFAVLLEHTTLAGARQVCERVCERVRQQVGPRAGLPDLRLTVSGGLAPATSGALDRADALLYAAKEAGRDRVLHEFPSQQPASAPPRPQDSPAWETVRSVLSFLVQPGGAPNLQGLLESAVACVPGAEAGSVIVMQGEAAVTLAQVGYDPTILTWRHSEADMRRWYGGDPLARRAGRPRILSGAELQRQLGPLASDPGATRLHANLLLPLVVDGEVLAELNLDSLSDPQAFGTASLRVAEEFGLLAAAALASGARQERERAAHEGALLALGLALEARDHETHGHTGRVVALAAVLGRALGLDEGEQEALRQGAYLHDLGKLQVPDSVLLKPGRLSDEELRVVRQHASIGAELAAYLPHLDPRAVEVIRHHHERWDGLGYPDGLSGEAIPRLARLFAVCDVYDALVSERPYKRAWSRDEALQEIRAQAGRHFDPQVALAFVDRVMPGFSPPADPPRLSETRSLPSSTD